MYMYMYMHMLVECRLAATHTLTLNVNNKLFVITSGIPLSKALDLLEICRIAGNFRGRNFRRSIGRERFAEKTCVEC